MNRPNEKDFHVTGKALKGTFDEYDLNYFDVGAYCKAQDKYIDWLKKEADSIADSWFDKSRQKEALEGKVEQLKEFKRLALEFASRFVDKVKTGEGVHLESDAGMKGLFLTYGRPDILAMKKKLSEKMKPLKKNYYGGSSRIYIESKDNRKLLIDTYHTSEFAAYIYKCVEDWINRENEKNK